MAKIRYRRIPDYLAKLPGQDIADATPRVTEMARIVGVADEFEALTLRQLFYQLVSRQLIANTQREYQRLGGLVTKLRYWGFLDWDKIVDRHRGSTKHAEFRDLKDLVNAAVYSYRTDWWRDETLYVELWCEKAALAGILEPIANRWHVTLMVNKGYSSASAMFEAAHRFDAHGKDGAIVYVGDHDPSGLDMVRDIQARLAEFGEDVMVDHVAVTMAQIEEYGLPPNPTKVTDSRSPDYVAEFGEVCWEADALRPDVLGRIVEDAILSYIDDMDGFEAHKSKDAKDAEKLRGMASGI